MPENPEYKPYYVQPDEEFRILGVATAVQKPIYSSPF
jgi:SOS-response transcriptional repressor LexA